MTVSVTIPTLNSEATLEACLESVENQTEHATEVIVIDGMSKDRTIEIAKGYRCEVIECKQALLAARVAGVRKASGSVIMLLDSDQCLEPTVIERIPEFMASFDSLCLEERAIEVRNWVQRMCQSRREMIQLHWSRFQDPRYGVILPRVFDSQRLKKAVDRIPPGLADYVSDRDHQILAYEYWRLFPRIGVIPHAAFHHEPSSLSRLVQKSWRWGLGTGLLTHSRQYRVLLERRFSTGLPLEPGKARSVRLSDFLLASLAGGIKGIPYELGLLVGRLRSPEAGFFRGVA